jgi:hypothetical protein
MMIIHTHPFLVACRRLGRMRRSLIFPLSVSLVGAGSAVVALSRSYLCCCHSRCRWWCTACDTSRRGWVMAVGVRLLLVTSACRGWSVFDNWSDLWRGTCSSSIDRALSGRGPVDWGNNRSRHSCTMTTIVGVGDAILRRLWRLRRWRWRSRWCMAGRRRS